MKDDLDKKNIMYHGNFVGNNSVLAEKYGYQ